MLFFFSYGWGFLHFSDAFLAVKSEASRASTDQCTVRGTERQCIQFNADLGEHHSDYSAPICGYRPKRPGVVPHLPQEDE